MWLEPAQVHFWLSQARAHSVTQTNSSPFFDPVKLGQILWLHTTSISLISPSIYLWIRASLETSALPTTEYTVKLVPILSVNASIIKKTTSLDGRQEFLLKSEPLLMVLKYLHIISCALSQIWVNTFLVITRVLGYYLEHPCNQLPS